MQLQIYGAAHTKVGVAEEQTCLYNCLTQEFPLSRLFFINGMHRKRGRPGPFYRLNRPNGYQGRQGRGSFIPRLFLWERGNVPGDEAREGEGGCHWLKELAGSLSL